MVQTLFEDDNTAPQEKPEEKVEEEKQPEETQEEEPTKNKRVIDPTKSATVFLGQLPYDTSEDQIRELFAKNDIEVRQVRMMREKETNKFRGMAFVDVPDGSVWKALNLHKTYFNGRMINVEETKDGGKHSAKKKDYINRMRNLHNKRTREQNTKFVETYLKTKKVKVLWSEFDEKSREAVITFPKEDIKEILDSVAKADFSKVKNKNTYLMGIVRRVRNKELGKE
ncbi:hypothetical protein WA577_002726 [Blastocystis sp. JDR]